MRENLVIRGKISYLLTCALLLCALLCSCSSSNTQEVYDNGYDAGYEEGRKAAYEEAYAEGLTAGKDSGYQTGYTDGWNDGYDSGVSDGIDQGKATAQAEVNTPATHKASTAPARVESSTVNSYTVYVTDTGTKYHRYGCSYLKSCNAISLSDAIARGYTACSRCKP